jgi:hypothetical protein
MESIERTTIGVVLCWGLRDASNGWTIEQLSMKLPDPQAILMVIIYSVITLIKFESICMILVLVMF